MGFLQFCEALPFLSGCYRIPGFVQSSRQLIVRAWVGGVERNRSLQCAGRAHNIPAQQESLAQFIEDVLMARVEFGSALQVSDCRFPVPRFQ